MTTTELTALLATPAAFRAWLEAKEPGEVVGDAVRDWKCPIANFLRSCGALCPVVRAVSIGVNFNPEIAPPPWVAAAVRATDRPNTPGTPITAAECLRILDGIEGGAT